MNDNVVYSYGGGEALFKVLNGVKMIFESGLSQDLIYLMTFIAASWAAFQGIQQNSWMPKLNWLAKYTLITSLFITPTATLWVSDSVTGFRNKVDGLPIGLVLPASVFSGIGFSLTQLFDQAFNNVSNNIPYHKYGQSFGASLISQARNFKIQDPVFRENMESFIDNCMLYDVMVGNKYSSSKLRDEKDIWTLVSKNASNIRMMNYRDDKSNSSRKLVTCREGVGLLESYWTKDINKLAERFGATTFGKFGKGLREAANNSNQETLSKAFQSNMEAVTALYGKSNGAMSTLKQVMMINAISDIPLSYGAVRAKQQQQESWLVSGQLAREILTTLHSVFAALIYASFTLIIGMLVLPNGLRTLGNYFGLLLWIETWPPLFAVLNMLTNLSGKLYGGDFTEITLNNASQIISHNNNISVVASGMMIVLPYLSYNILKGGAGQFVHLASQVMGASQSAAVAASNEVTSGNRSFDNVSISNGQWFNNSGFKTDMNAMYRSGHREYQFNDGTIARETVSGNTILQSGPGITHSVGSKSMHMTYSDTSQVHEAIGYEQAMAKQKQDQFSELKSLLDSKSVDLVKRMAYGESSGEHYNINHSTGEGKTLTSALAQAKDLQDNYSYNHNQVNEKTISGNIGFSKEGPGSGSGGVIGDTKPGGSLGKIGGGLLSGLSGGVNASVTGKTDSLNSQSLAENNSVSNRVDVNTQSEDIARAAKDIQFSENQSEEKALAESLVGTYQKMQEVRRQITVSQDNIRRHQRSLEHSSSSNFSMSDDMYHKALNDIANSRDKYGFRIGEKRAAEIMDNGSDESEEYFKAFVAKHIPSQKIHNPNFNEHYYNQIVKENIPQDINMKESYDRIKDEGQKELAEQAQINHKAKTEYESRMDSIRGKIEERENKIISKGEKAQQIVNNQQKDRSDFSKENLGRNKNENNSFIDD